MTTHRLPLFQVYVMTKKKDGTVTKSEGILVRAEDVDKAIVNATSDAKTHYGFRGTVHIGSVFQFQKNGRTKTWTKVNP